MQLWFPDIVNRISNAGNSSASTVCDILDNSNLEMENDTAMEAVVNKIANLIILFTYVHIYDSFRCVPIIYRTKHISTTWLLVLRF